MFNARVLWLCALVTAAGTAPAQDRGGPEVHSETRFAISIGGPASEGDGNAINERSLDAYARILGLDGDQKVAARELLTGYRAANRRLQDEQRAKLAALSENMRASSDDPGSIKRLAKVMSEELPKVTAETRERERANERQFLDDLRALLNDQQAPRFAGVERHRRREVGLPGIQVYGGATDVSEVARRIVGGAGITPGLAEVLDGYEQELDRLLVERRRLLDESEKKLAEAHRKAGEKDDAFALFNADDMESVNKPIAESGTRIRDLNRQTASRVGAMLSPADRERFEGEIRRREFPRVYRRPHVVKALEAASKFPDLTEAQKSELGAMKAAYAREAGPLNEAWAAALEERQKDRGGMIVVQTSRVSDEKDPLAEARKARKELDERFEKRLALLLSEAQRSRLPAAKPEKPRAQVSVSGGGPGMAVPVDMEDFGINLGDDEDNE